MSEAASPARPRLPAAAAMCALFAIAVLPFVPALSGGFVFDDSVAITGNQAVTSDFSLANIFGSGFWGGDEVNNSGSYRPLTVLSFAIDYRLGGGEPWIFHLSNLLLHGLCVLAVFWVLGRRFGRGIGLAVAALFAVHALHAENAASLVGRADVLATIFGLISWRLYECKRPALAATSGLLLLASILAKEIGIAFLGLVIAEEILKARPAVARPSKAKWLALAAMVCAVAVYLAMRIDAIGTISAKVTEQSNPLIGDVGLASRVLTGSALLSKAVSLFAFPATLSADYSYAEIMPVTSLADPAALIGLILWLGLPIFAVVMRRRSPGVTVGLLLFFAAYFPISNILLVVPTIFAERLLYLPSLGLCLAVVVALAPSWRNPRLRALSCALLVAAVSSWSVRSFARARDWRSPKQLFAAATHAAPKSARNWFNLAVATLSEEKPAEALRYLNRSLSIYSKQPEAHSYAGVALDKLERPKEAHEAMFRAVRMQAWCRECAMNLVNLYIKYGFFDDAWREIANFRAAGGEPRTADELSAKVDAVYQRAVREGVQPKRRQP